MNLCSMLSMVKYVKTAHATNISCKNQLNHWIEVKEIIEMLIHAN